MKYFLFTLFLSICNIFTFAQKTINFSSEKELLWIGKNISVFEDVEGTLTIEDILKTDIQKKFQRNTGLLFQKPISSSTYWLKFTVSNQSHQDIWLALERSFIVTLDFYTPDNSGNYKLIKTGAIRPFDSRPYPIINGFWLPLNKAQEKEAKTYYVRIQSVFALDIPIQIATRSKLYEQKVGKDNLSNLFIGVMLIMILYNSFLFIVTKDNIYVLYTGYLITITIITTFFNSYPFIEYLTGHQIQYFLHYYFPIWEYPVLIFSAMFCIKYLDLKTNAPRTKKVLEWIILSHLLTIFLNITGLATISVIAVLSQVLPILLYLTAISIAFYLFFFKNLKQARYYLLGWSFFFIGLICLILSANGWIPYHTYLRNAFYFGIMLEVWMFSLALGERLKVLQKEKEVAQAKNLALIEKQKNTLEKTVKERTIELEQQKEELQANNEVLKENEHKLQNNQKVLQKSRSKLQKTLVDNENYLKEIEQQKEELKVNNEVLKANEEKLQNNQKVLQKSRLKLQKTLVDNKNYLKEIEQQKEELQANNDELLAKEEELRQNFEELQSTQEILEAQRKQLEITSAENKSITNALSKSALVSISDLKGDLIQVNDIYSEVSGYTREELLGNNQSMLDSGHHPKSFWQNLRDTLKEGNTWRGEIRNKAKNGSFYWVDTVINPMYDKEGKIYSYLSILSLITDRKRAEKKIKSQNARIKRKNEKISQIINTISNISKNTDFGNQSWYSISGEAMQASINILGIDTCQLWYYDAEIQVMSCVAHESHNKQNPMTLYTLEDKHLFFKVMKQEIIISIDDLENDKRIKKKDKAYFLQQGYKAFILYPIILSKKHKGVLACFHSEAHIWENEDMVLLKSLNDEFQLAYQAFRREQAKAKIEEQNKKISLINERINESLAYAASIQKSILVSITQIKQHLPESFIFFNPLEVVSGDFYFFAQIKYKAIIAAIDCTGHGIPGAFMSLIGNNLLSEIVNVKSCTRPDKILNMLKEDIVKVLKQDENNNQDGMDLAICTIDTYPEEVYDTVGIPQLEYAGANNPLVYFQDNQINYIKGDKIIIGGIRNYSEEETFTLHRIPLDKPTTFYIFSDGIQDQFGGKDNKKFTPRRLRKLLEENYQKPMQEQKEIISHTIKNWQKQGNEEQIDDMLLIGIQLSKSTRLLER